MKQQIITMKYPLLDSTAFPVPISVTSTKACLPFGQTLEATDFTKQLHDTILG
jgi:hypothetical protein